MSGVCIFDDVIFMYKSVFEEHVCVDFSVAVDFKEFIVIRKLKN